MSKKNNTIEIIIEPSFYVGICLLLLLIPLDWVFAWFLAAAFHEMCHILLICLLKYRIYSIKTSITGMTMHTENMKQAHEMIVALAGPVGSLLLLFFARFIPAIALCAMFQSAYNLIPVFPYDGGRALRCFFLSVFPDIIGEKVFVVIENIFLILLGLVTAYFMIRFNLGLFPILMMLSVLLKKRILKIPCKASKQRVQYSTQTIRGTADDKFTSTHSPYGSKAGSIYRRGI